MSVGSNAIQTQSFDLSSLVQVLDFFHQSVTLSTMVVTVTDYRDGSCAYVSPTLKDLTGFEPALLRESGMNWFVNRIHPDDRSQYKINFTEGFLFMLNLPTEQKLSCYFNLTVRLVHKTGDALWIYQQCRPLALDEKGKPLYSINVITDLTPLMSGNRQPQPCWSVVEQPTGAKPIFLGGSCNDTMHWLFGTALSPLTRKETEILKMLMKGESGKQVAGRLGISINTLNTHRKSIIRKAKAKNLNEAISLALRNDWIHE